jgi:predicted nucleic acid-binding protein
VNSRGSSAVSEGPVLVVDASVAVKWFVTRDESAVEEAAALLAAHARSESILVGPSLLVHESMNALRRRRAEVPDLVGATDTFFDFGVALVPPDRELMISAARLCAERTLSTSDATYAALALALDCELVTADRRLGNALVGVCRVRVL